MTDVQHAFCAPSDYEGWSNCPGKPALEEFEPDNSSADSIFGSQAHEWAHTTISRLQGLAAPAADIEQEINDLMAAVPADMAAGVRLYVEAVLNRADHYRKAGAQVLLLVEQRLDISVITGEDGARGTADVVLLAQFEDHSRLDVWDLKFGVGVVVPVENNGQIQIYALAALIKYQLLHNFTEINLVIHQPRVKETPSEWRITPEALYVFGQRATEAAHLALSLRGEASALSHLMPGDKQCRFCRVRYRCPALQEMIHKEVYGDFQKIDDPKIVPVSVADKALFLSQEEIAALLSRAMKRIPLILDWCKQVRSMVDKELLAGRSVPDFMLAEGRKGDRRFTNQAVVEFILQEANYTPNETHTQPELKSPAQLEKILKRDDPETWELLGEWIKQDDGKPSVVLTASNKTPWTAAAKTEDFDSYEGQDLV